MTHVGLMVFCLRSLFREYGFAFLVRVALRHPFQCWARLKDYLGRSSRESGSERPPEALTAHLRVGNQGMVLVGLGFCLKPIDPECPSGRANHDCAFFDHYYDRRRNASVIPACRSCQIRIIGLAALRSGCSLYIMTSAMDILEDMLLPALEKRRFRAALLALCRYSFAPIEIALALVGLNARLIPFAGGDCRDYRMWRRADKGVKEDQTRLETQDKEHILALLEAEKRTASPLRLSQTGNIYHPAQETEPITPERE